MIWNGSNVGLGLGGKCRSVFESFPFWVSEFGFRRIRFGFGDHFELGFELRSARIGVVVKLELASVRVEVED